MSFSDLVTLITNYCFQAAESVDLWLSEDPLDYQTVIAEPNQEEIYAVKNVELKSSREKKKKTKDGEVT
jgi:hypothetical protein